MTHTSPPWSRRAPYAAGPHVPQWTTLTQWDATPLTMEPDVVPAPPRAERHVALIALAGVLLILLAGLLVLGLADYVAYIVDVPR